MLDPDFFKTLVHTRVKAPVGGSGFLHLNMDSDEIYARQVLSEVRVIHPGKPKPEWVPIRRDNHYLDCEAIAAAMGYTINVQSIPEGVRRSYGDDSPDDEDATEETETDEVEAEAVEPDEQAASDLRKRFGRFGRNSKAR